MSKKPTLLYRLSKDETVLYLRVPDEDTETDSVLTFNRVMADYGYPDPKDIFNERLGVAVVPAKIKRRSQISNKLVTFDMLSELEQHFLVTPIPDRDWYTKRF